MGKAVAKKKPPAQETPALDALALEIEKLHQGTMRSVASGVEYAMQCGDYLIAAKKLMDHGEWLPWLEANTTMGIRQAQRYMRLYNHRAEIEAGKCDPGTYLPINEALALIAEKKPQEPKIDPNRPFNGLTAVEYVEQGCPDLPTPQDEEDEWEDMPAGYVLPKPDKITKRTMPDGEVVDEYHYREDDKLRRTYPTVEIIEHDEAEEPPNKGCNYDPADPRGFYKGEEDKAVRRRAWLAMAADAKEQAESFLADGGHRAIAIADPDEIDDEIMEAVASAASAWLEVGLTLKERRKGKRASTLPQDGRSDPTPENKALLALERELKAHKKK